ncbi:hypothetical protein TL16_g05915 [Triparma laevis f. inornata]|uniref:SRR1-like domain-containing protein n=2 Tax=Triparma laevis TaxID=1534972 RepID=A0A9W7FNK1_9STRA|nr:hypothetical protein TL16_g05915 [Triparma laevis f. inornata]GMI15984.1 hypothetical protein TrLO_g3352 [Triparma laevis f. longispina]
MRLITHTFQHPRSPHRHNQQSKSSPSTGSKKKKNKTSPQTPSELINTYPSTLTPPPLNPTTLTSLQTLFSEIIRPDDPIDLEDCKYIIALGLGEITLSSLNKIRLGPDSYLPNSVKQFKDVSDLCEGKEGRYYDPMMSSEDLRYLPELCEGLAIIKETEKGWRGDLKVFEKTCFFMPTCPRELYEIVLSNNKDNLKDLIIIGNSFRGYEEQIGGWVEKPREWREEGWREYKVMMWDGE